MDTIIQFRWWAPVSECWGHWADIRHCLHRDGQRYQYRVLPSEVGK